MPSRQDKTDARTAVSRAIREGALPPPTVCEACGETQKIRRINGTTAKRVVYHHWSYAPEHWLDVIPLCQSCHHQIHWGQRLEPRTNRVYDASARHETMRRAARAAAADRAETRRRRREAAA